MIYVASDHGGFKLKTTILNLLQSLSLNFKDMGPFEYVLDDDYPDYIIPAINKIQEDPTENKGIFICRNGIGVCMLANKYKEIRAGLSWNPEHAISGRFDDNTNVLCLPADYINKQEALIIVTEWLETQFSQEPRHLRRLKKIDEIEK